MNKEDFIFIDLSVFGRILKSFLFVDHDYGNDDDDDDDVSIEQFKLIFAST